MCKNSLLMIHLPYVGVIGNKLDLQKEIEVLESVENVLMNVYTANLIDKSKRKEIENKLYEETWFTADEAAKYFSLEITNDTETTSQVIANTRNQKQSVLQRVAASDDSDAEKYKRDVLKRLGSKAGSQTPPNSKGNVLEQMKKKGQEGVKQTFKSQQLNERQQVEKTKENVLEKFKKVGTQ